MKLTELSDNKKTRHVRRVFESIFDQNISIETLKKNHAETMLSRVGRLLEHYKRSSGFHHSEKNPSYLKLLMIEQSLRDYLANSSNSIIVESEVQQAQVVLAAQDMVDQVQGMLEDVSELQFKDLPALVDSIKNQIGMDQSSQFNQDATQALAGLVQNLQLTKQQLETALGVVTGQASAIDTLPAPDVDSLGLDSEPQSDPAIDQTELDIESPDPVGGPNLGRARR